MKPTQQQTEILNMDVCDFCKRYVEESMSVRLFNAFKDDERRNGFKKVKDVITSKTYIPLRKMRNIGRYAEKAFCDALEKNGLHLGMSIDEQTEGDNTPGNSASIMTAIIFTSIVKQKRLDFDLLMKNRDVLKPIINQAIFFSTSIKLGIEEFLNYINNDPDCLFDENGNFKQN